MGNPLAMVVSAAHDMQMTNCRFSGDVRIGRITGKSRIRNLQLEGGGLYIGTSGARHERGNPHWCADSCRICLAEGPAVLAFTGSLVIALGTDARSFSGSVRVQKRARQRRRKRGKTT